MKITFESFNPNSTAKIEISIKEIITGFIAAGADKKIGKVPFEVLLQDHLCYSRRSEEFRIFHIADEQWEATWDCLWEEYTKQSDSPMPTTAALGLLAKLSTKLREMREKRKHLQQLKNDTEENRLKGLRMDIEEYLGKPSSTHTFSETFKYQNEFHAITRTLNHSN